MESRRNVASQTFVATFIHAGTQSSRTNASVFPTTTGVLEFLLDKKPTAADDVLALVGDDAVVEYADEDDHEEVDVSVPERDRVVETKVSRNVNVDDEATVALGKRVMVIPRTPSPSPPASREASVAHLKAQSLPSPAPPHTVPDEAPRLIARLRRELEELRESSTLRERELHSIVENCRNALKAEEARETERRESAHKAEVDGLQRSLQQLKDIIAKREETIREKTHLLSIQDALLDEARRERDRHWMVLEGQLHSEVARLKGDKEKLRFEAEVANNRVGALAVAHDTLQARAHHAEVLWNCDRERELFLQEAILRSAIAEVAATEARGMFHTLREVQRVDDYHTIRTEERWQHMYRRVEAAMQYDGEEGLCKLDEIESLTVHSATDATLAKDVAEAAAEHMLRDLVRRRAVEWRKRQEEERQDAAARDSLLETLQGGVHSWMQALTSLEDTVGSRLNGLGLQCDTLARLVDVCSKRIENRAGERATARASASVLEELVAQHARETEQLRAELRVRGEALETIRRTTKVDEAAQLQLTCAAQEAKLRACETELHLAKAKLLALEQAASSMASGTTEQRGHMHRAQEEAESLRQALHDERTRHHAETVSLRDTVSELEKRVKRLTSELQETQDENALSRKRSEHLQHQLQTLKDKFVSDKSDEVVARVNRSLSAAFPSGTAASFAAGNAAAAAAASAEELERLQQRVLVLKRDNDSLRSRLDSALAEASHAEEQRRMAMERSLSLMALEDAVPKRQMELLSQQADMMQKMKALDAREAQLNQRLHEVERREGLLRRPASKLPGLPQHLASSTPHTPTSPTEVDGRPASGDPNGQGGSAANDAAPRRRPSAGPPVHLAPLVQRPVAQVARIQEAHPQKFVPQTS